MPERHPLAPTYDRILNEGLPNLLRLYVNPFVAQACLCLERYVQATWPAGRREGAWQSFLANSFDEALGGAIKLARYCASVAGKPTLGLVVDDASRLGAYAAAHVRGQRIEFIPGLVPESESFDAAQVGFVVLIGPLAGDFEPSMALRRRIDRDAPIIITCLDRARLAALRRAPSGPDAQLKPAIVVFDESFVNGDVPFGAFTAPRMLFDHWNTPGKTTFHSTTFQPNTISAMHFVHCVRHWDPDFYASLAAPLDRILGAADFRREVFRTRYSPSLYQVTRLAGFDTDGLRVNGHYAIVDGQRIFDAVSGVACSVRGHNPAGYADEMAQLAGVDCRAEVARRLRDLTGLPSVLPAVSGATAVENGLRIALLAQHPRRRVLALKAGFGGKTLLALAGTANPSYKEHIGPLYADVLYVDPFASDALSQLEAALRPGDVAVVELELIQAVGGVRRVPDDVVRFLDRGRERWDYLLLIDEVQTGMYRTGPFTLSRAMGIRPDLLTLGKGISDMMFPFSLLLCTEGVRAALDRSECDLPREMEVRYGYEVGYRTALNVLRRAEEMRLPERIAQTGALFDRLLTHGLANAAAVRALRVFGLLIGIELDATRWPRRWFRKRLGSIYLNGLLNHKSFPVLGGFCQCEPNVLKLTPPLTTTLDEVRDVSRAILDVLTAPFHRLLASALGRRLRPRSLGRIKH